MQPIFDTDVTPLAVILETVLNMTATNFDDAQLQLDAAAHMEQLIDLENLLDVDAPFIPAMEL